MLNLNNTAIVLSVVLSTDFYEQVLALFEENRVKGYKIAKFKIAHWALVGLSGPEGVEKLLSSNKLINKSSDYDILHKWLGLGLLTR